MGTTTIASGLTLTIPTSGTKNWAALLQSGSWEKISAHNHSGGGLGSQLVATSALTANSVDKTVITKNLALWQATTIVPTSGSTTVNLSNGNIQYIDMSTGTTVGDVVLALTNPIAGAEYKIIIKSSATYKASFSGVTLKWPQGQDPTSSGEYLLSLSSGKIDIVTMYYDGTNAYADWQIDFS